jgi:hypothetical protein
MKHPVMVPVSSSVPVCIPRVHETGCWGITSKNGPHSDYQEAPQRVARPEPVLLLLTLLSQSCPGLVYTAPGLHYTWVVDQQGRTG